MWRPTGNKHFVRSISSGSGRGEVQICITLGVNVWRVNRTGSRFFLRFASCLFTGYRGLQMDCRRTMATVYIAAKQTPHTTNNALRCGVGYSCSIHTVRLSSVFGI